MKVIHYTEAESKQFEADGVKGVTGRVVIGQADGAENFCMRVFELAEGGYSPCHAHDWEHEIFVHAGDGEVLRKGEWQPVTTGNVVFIPGNEKHQIRNNGQKPFVFVCLIPVGAPEL